MYFEGRPWGVNRRRTLQAVTLGSRDKIGLGRDVGRIVRNGEPGTGRGVSRCRLRGVGKCNGGN